jgi:hypothetical protein
MKEWTMTIRRLSLLLVAILAISLSVVAQECSIQTITGVYFYRGAGHSFMGAAPLPLATVPDPAHAILPLHAPGAYLNGSQLGVITVHPDYTVDTVTWLAMGPLRKTGETGTATISSIGWEYTPGGQVLGCRALLEYSHPQFGAGLDKFLVFDNGNEIRGVHALNGNPITDSMFVGKRISRSLDAAPRCGAQTLKGSYVASCQRGLLYKSDGTTLGINSMLDLRISEGTIEGIANNRIESSAFENPISGTIVINPDCTGEGYLEGLIPGLTGKAVFAAFAFEQGKGAFLFPTELELPNGTRVPYPTTQSCTLERMNP